MDILIENSNDLAIRGGDFVVGESGLQDIYLILLLEKGTLKQSPRVGVGANRLRNATVTPELRREIQLQLAADGIRARQIQLTPDKLNIEI